MGYVFENDGSSGWDLCTSVIKSIYTNYGYDFPLKMTETNGNRKLYYKNYKQYYINEWSDARTVTSEGWRLYFSKGVLLVL